MAALRDNFIGTKPTSWELRIGIPRIGQYSHHLLAMSVHRAFTPKNATAFVTASNRRTCRSLYRTAKHPYDANSPLEDRRSWLYVCLSHIHTEYIHTRNINQEYTGCMYVSNQWPAGILLRLLHRKAVCTYSGVYYVYVRSRDNPRLPRYCCRRSLYSWYIYCSQKASTPQQKSRRSDLHNLLLVLLLLLLLFAIAAWWLE